MNALKVVVLSVASFMSLQAAAVCTAYCTPGKSYACGGGCISVYKLCRKPTTTACNGTRPPEASKHYSTPTKVEPKDFSKESSGGGVQVEENLQNDKVN